MFDGIGKIKAVEKGDPVFTWLYKLLRGDCSGLSVRPIPVGRVLSRTPGGSVVCVGVMA